MSLENELLSKVVDTDSFHVLAKYNITSDDYISQKKTY